MILGAQSIFSSAQLQNCREMMHTPCGHHLPVIPGYYQLMPLYFLTAAVSLGTISKASPTMP